MGEGIRQQDALRISKHRVKSLTLLTLLPLLLSREKKKKRKKKTRKNFGTGQVACSQVAQIRDRVAPESQITSDYFASCYKPPSP